RTGSDGSIGVIFKDNTVLSLGPDSLLEIDEYVYAPNRGKYSMIIKMFKGTVSYLSGLISRLSPEATRFETPTASLGIRGTRFLVKVGE
ncbi:MAG: FecR domain-containing protein, partial [Desulfobacterales bacterium]|nr:FecR domain-containing protein [Desulfobacterales bacterium]